MIEFSRGIMVSQFSFFFHHVNSKIDLTEYSFMVLILSSSVNKKISCIALMIFWIVIKSLLEFQLIFFTCYSDGKFKLSVDVVVGWYKIHIRDPICSSFDIYQFQHLNSAKKVL